MFISSKNFEKATRKLPIKTRARLAERLRIFAVDPFNPLLNNHALHGSIKNYRSINITGDYRVVFEEIETDVIHLIDIDTHSNLYGR